MTRLQQSAEHRCASPAACCDWTDEELLLDYAATGQRASFETLVARHEDAVYRYLRKYLGAEDLAEDAFQATFLQIHLKCGRFTPGRRLRPWLYRIATNQAIDLMRRNRRHRAVSLDSPRFGAADKDRSLPMIDTLKAAGGDAATILQAAEELQRLTDAMQKTPPRSRQVLALVLCEGLSYREAAEILDIPVGTVKSRLNSAIHRLQKILTAQTIGVDGDPDERSYYRPLPANAAGTVPCAPLASQSAVAFS